MLKIGLATSPQIEVGRFPFLRFSKEIIIFQGQFSIISAFSIENSKVIRGEEIAWRSIKLRNILTQAA